MTVLAFTQLRTPADGVVASIADTRAGDHAVRPLGRGDRQLGRGHRPSHLRLGYAWSGRVLRQHGAAATVLAGRHRRIRPLQGVADHSGRLASGANHPAPGRHRSCCSKDCRLTDPLHAAGSQLNLPTEFVARVGNRFSKEESRWHQKVTLFPAEACCASGLLGLGGLVSGCGSAFASGIAGTRPPGNTLSYWNLFGGGDGSACRRWRTASEGHTRRRALTRSPWPGATRTTRSCRWPRSGRKPPDVAVAAPDPDEDAGRGRPAGGAATATTWPGSASRRQVRTTAVEGRAGGREGLRDPARHPPVRAVLQHRRSARRPGCSTATAS